MSSAVFMRCASVRQVATARIPALPRTVLFGWAPAALAMRTRNFVRKAHDWSALRQQYDRDGYVIIRDVIDGDLVKDSQRHVDFLLNKYPDIPPEHFHHIIMRNDPFWVRLISDDRLLDVAAGLAPFIDRDIALFSSHYFCKLPGKGMPVKWHQDGSYWPLKPMNVVTLWLAVDHSDRENGCLKVVPGSHKQDLKELKPSKGDLNVLGSATHEDDEIAEESVVYLELNPGDVSIHHPNIVHASDANTSDRRRCGLTIRYISPETQCLDAEQPVMMMRGQPKPGINFYRSWPKYRPGYDMPFNECDTWNQKRLVNPDDEPFFARTDYDEIEKEIRHDLNKFIDALGGR